MKTKKCLAILLSVALLIGVMPLTGLVLSTSAQTTETAATELVAYVSTAATGSGTLGDSEDPYPTMPQRRRSPRSLRMLSLKSTRIPSRR